MAIFRKNIKYLFTRDIVIDIYETTCIYTCD